MFSVIIHIEMLYELSAIKEKEAMNLMDSQQGIWNRFEEGKGRGKLL